MGGLGSLLFDVGASTVTLSSDLSRGAGLVDKFANDAVITINSVNSRVNFSGVTAQLAGLEASVASVQGAISGVLGVGIGAGMAKEAMDYADAWLLSGNRIQSAVGDASQVATIQKEILDVAQATGTAIDDNAKTYQRLSTILASSGKDQASASSQAIDLTRELNEEIVVSGANVGEATHAINDLVHGLAGGVLQARQFNPIMRQMPDLANQIAQGLGVSVKQLEEMVHAGLPAEQVLEALNNQAGTIHDRFTSLPETFARAWQQLDNSVEAYVGTAAQASTLTDLAKDGIVGLGNNIDTVAKGAIAAGAAMGIWLGGKVLTTLGSMSSALYDVVTAQGAYKTAAILSAEADVASSTAQVAALTQTIAKTDAMNDLRISERMAIETQVSALATEIAALEREAVAGNNVLASSERLIAARAELSTATVRAAELENTMAAAQAKATLAEQAEVAATVELTAAKTTLVAAQAEVTAATGLFARAGASLFTLLGGWPTVILAIGAGLYYMATAESQAQKEGDALSKVTSEIQAAHNKLSPAMEETAQAAFTEAAAMRDATQAQLDHLKAQQDDALAAGKSGEEIFAFGVQAGNAQKDVDGLTAKIADLAGAFLKAKAAAAGNWLVNLLAPDFKVSLAAVDDFSAGLSKMGDHFKEQAATYKLGHAALVQYKIDQELAKESVGKNAEQIAQLSERLKTDNADTLANARALDAQEASYKSNTKALTEKQKAQKAYAADVESLTNLEDQLSSGLGGPYLAAFKSYQKGVEETSKTWADATIAGTANDDLIGRLSHDQEMLGQTLDQTNKRIKDQHDLLTQSAKAITDEQVVLHALPQQQDAVRAGLDAYNKAMIDHIDLTGRFIPDEEELRKKLQDQLPAYVANKQALHDLDEQQKLNEQTAKDWVSVWQTAGDGVVDTFSKILVEGGSLMDGLKSIAQQTVEAIISYFAKLAIINPILNAVFGGSAGFSLLPSLASAASSVAGSGGGGNAYNWTAGADGGTESAGGSSMFSTASNGVSLFNAGKTLYSGFQSGFDNFLFGSNSSASGWLGSYSANMYGPGGTFAPSALGYGVSIAGGVYAGYDEFNRAGGGAAGVAGGLSYGVGTTALGLGVASLATGGGLVAGLGALGPVGWAALALMAVDMISGGKLFGTAGKFNFGQSTIAVGADGATVSQGYDMKGQKALFGGSTHSWHDVTPDQAAVDAANAFYDALRTGTESFAKEFGVKVGDIVGGSFTQTFDKHGNVTATSDTVLGKTYSDDAQHFEERLDAENMIAVLSQFDAKLSDSVDQYRTDADQLMAVTQALAQGEAMMQDGTTFLALGSDQSLSALLALAQGSVRFGETVDQTLQRIEQSQAQYTQFVAGFKPPTNYVDDFEASLAGIRDQMIANEKQANDLAIAAGAAGASEEDLANIQKYAVAQEKEAIKQLQASAQSLAFGMGLTSIGSLDEVNAEIAQLQQQAGQATSPIANMGAAIRQTAQDATAALNLLLGDLSPLNDAQKLEKARAGLIAGSVTTEQFDEIARRLYGSSQQYVDEFNFAQQYAGRSGGTPGIPDGSQHQGLSAADKKRLADLLKEQADLQKQQGLQNAQTLAMQIAELASAKNEDFDQVIKDMGIDKAALEKILGMNDAQFAALIAADQAAKDDNGDNTKSIVTTLNDGFTRVVNAITGKPDVDPTPKGSGHSTHMDPRDFGRQIVDAIVTHSRNFLPNNRRQMG